MMKPGRGRNDFDVIYIPRGRMLSRGRVTAPSTIKVSVSSLIKVYPPFSRTMKRLDAKTLDCTHFKVITMTVYKNM